MLQVLLVIYTAAAESVAVPYPAPANWSHAWPYDFTTGVFVDRNVEVKVSASEAHAQDPLTTEILTRYQTLLRSKVSANDNFRGYAQLPVLRTVSVVIHDATAKGLTLGPTTDESYQISVDLKKSAANTDTASVAVVAVVTAQTVYGARHGLESLAQLVATPAGIISGVNASIGMTLADSPAYSYRGVMIDTGRHFLSLATIMHIIDGMSALKLNVLHWHILDSTSFPVESLKFPNLTKGAYSAAAVYSQDDLRNLVKYARSRGVRVVVEIEMPGHGSFSAGMPELSLTSCYDVLNPTKEATYTFLAEFLAEMTTIFDDALIYLGGDEVGFDPKCTWPGDRVCGYHCFDKDPQVAAWMKDNQMNATQLLDHFWETVSAKVVPSINRTVGVWMADRPNGAGGSHHVWPAPHMSTLPKGSVANVYQSMQTAAPLLDAGVPVVLSVASSDWYLDYHPDFEDVYKVIPCGADQLDCSNHPHRRANILGGSVSQWGESVDAFNINPDLWIGATALAERLWSDMACTGTCNMTTMANDARARHHNLQCHWAHWGVSTYTRTASRAESTTVADASLSNLCPADWSPPPQ